MPDSIPYYSANGRIRHVLVFLKKKFQLPEVKNPNSEFKNLIEVFYNVYGIAHWLGKKNARLTVCFTYDGSYSKPDSVSHPTVNFQGFTASIEGYVKDEFIAVKKKDSNEIRYLCEGQFQPTIYHHSSPVAEDLRLFMENNIFGVKTDRVNTIFDGGNILRGRYEFDDYVLIGSPEYWQMNIDETANKLSVKKEKIFQVHPSNKYCDFGKPLYHIDLYLTIAGAAKHPFYKKQEVLLLAEARGTVDSMVNEFNSEFNKMAHEILCFKSVPFLLVRLPMILWQDDSSNIHILSYNNCIVENYINEKGKHILAFHFPCYRCALEGYALELIALNRNEALIHFHNELRKLIKGDYFSVAKNMDFDAEKPAEIFAEYNREVPMWDDLNNSINIMIEEVTSEITALCKTLGADEVCFVESKNYVTSGSAAGLHCITLVTQRDLVG